MQLIIRQPETPKEWDQYFELRWQVLRAPWQQAAGSEKDELEETSIHRLAIADDMVIAVGRLHFNNSDEAQIRYMAVTPDYQQLGVGQKLLKSLELAAIEEKAKIIRLNAREPAINFYQKNQYKIIAPSHTLYGSIKHVKMEKIFS